MPHKKEQTKRKANKRISANIRAIRPKPRLTRAQAVQQVGRKIRRR